MFYLWYLSFILKYGKVYKNPNRTDWLPVSYYIANHNNFSCDCQLYIFQVKPIPGNDTILTHLDNTELINSECIGRQSSRGLENTNTNKLTRTEPLGPGIQHPAWQMQDLEFHSQY